MITLACFIIGVCVGMHLCTAIAVYCLGGSGWEVGRQVVAMCVLSVVAAHLIVAGVPT